MALAALSDNTRSSRIRLSPTAITGLFLLASFFVAFAQAWLPTGFFRPPAWLLPPLVEWLNLGFEYLRDDLGLIHLTRLLASWVSAWLDVINNLFWGGRGGWNVPALPWTIFAFTALILGLALRGWGLGLLAAGTFVYLALFGQWKWAMQTLSLVAIAAPLAIALGTLIGVLAYRHRWLEKPLMGFLNIMQSMPHFSYLIPVVVFFGVGDHAGAIATVIFATPPMIRLTLLGLQKVSPEVLEAGAMSGSNRWQMLCYVQLPSARNEMLVGVNQVIMQCFAMVVIASFIGAPGLGYKLLLMLQSLKIGKALELGLSIVLIAITLDRLSKAWVEKAPSYHANALTFWQRYRWWWIWLGGLLLCYLLLRWFDWGSHISRRHALSTAPFWDALVALITVSFYDIAQGFRQVASVHFLIPIRDFYLSLPYTSVALGFAAIAYWLGAWRSVGICLGWIAIIAFSGFWDRAMITAYMVSVAVAFSVCFGVPLGVWAARRPRRSRWVLLLCDTLQTFPSFIYLIPVIMLFQVNDLSAIAAVVIYATIPMLRYTVEGLRSVPDPLNEAVSMCGAGRFAKLWHLQLPYALPHLLLGLNQTILFSLFMVIIAAFIGTQDLGQEMMRALSANDVGKGLMLGFCVAAMGLTMDHLITQAAKARRRALGI